MSGTRPVGVIGCDGIIIIIAGREKERESVSSLWSLLLLSHSGRLSWSCGAGLGELVWLQAGPADTLTGSQAHRLTG